MEIIDLESKNCDKINKAVEKVTWQIIIIRYLQKHFITEYTKDNYTCNLKYNVPNKKSIVFPNGSWYYYHFIIRHLAKEFQIEFNCLGENIEKCITFSVATRKKATRIDNNVEKITKAKSYRFQCIDITRFTGNSLSNPVNNLAEGVHKIKCNYEHLDKNVKLVELNTKIENNFLNTQVIKMS